MITLINYYKNEISILKAEKYIKGYAYNAAISEVIRNLDKSLGISAYDAAEHFVELKELIYWMAELERLVIKQRAIIKDFNWFAKVITGE
jgi:hypothetical protein